MRLDCSTSSLRFSYITIFAAIILVLDAVPVLPFFYSGVWDSWAFLLSPLIGVLLGPLNGALSVGIGTVFGHLLYFRDPFELVFMWGTPLGSAMTGFLYQRAWKPALVSYSFLLASYFLTPIAWSLSLLGIWDILLGYVILFLISIVYYCREIPDSITIQRANLVFIIMIGLEFDILFRVFILIPCYGYWFFYGLTVNQLQLLWLGAGIITPIKVFLSTLLGITILSSLRSIPHVLSQYTENRETNQQL